MINQKLIRVLGSLSTDEFKTADTIAEISKVSNKTVRMFINELKKYSTQYGFSIISKPRFGYLLKINDETKYKEIHNSISKNNLELPSGKMERETFILKYLFEADDFAKIDDIADIIFVSRATLTNDLKSIEKSLQEFGVSIIRKSNYGVKLNGNESDFRRYMEAYSMAPVKNFQKNERIDKDLKTISTILSSHLKKYELVLPENQYLSIMTSLMIQSQRLRIGKTLKIENIIQQDIDQTLSKIAESISDQLSDALGVGYSKEERNNVYLHLLSKGMYQIENTNLLIDQVVVDLVDGMLDEIYKEFAIDFRNDFELKMQLTQHLFPMNIRVKYDFFYDNPLIDEIKERYTLAFSIAAQASVVLVKHHNKYIAQDEIGFLALIFQLALERRGKTIRKSNIMIVCGTGRGSSQLLKYKYKQLFNEYIENIIVCEVQELDGFDFSAIDYLFSTVPIEKHLPIPIHEIGSFLDNVDIRKVRYVLENENYRVVSKYYIERNFIPMLKANSKDEVIRELTNHVQAIYGNCERLYQSVIDRENLASTEFGNRIAMAHTLEPLYDKTIVLVAILEKPIVWLKKPVQVVIFTSIGKEKDPNIQIFYEATTNLFFNEAGITQLIADRSFDTMYHLLVGV